jgi:hypothetical protein
MPCFIFLWKSNLQALITGLGKIVSIGFEGQYLALKQQFRSNLFCRFGKNNFAEKHTKYTFCMFENLVASITKQYLARNYE